MEELGETNYRIEVDGKSEVGDNYMGEVIFFRIISLDSKHEYSFVMKTAKKSEELRKKVPIEEAYTRELFMYSKIFQYFREFIQEVNPEFEFDFVPKVYSLDSSPQQETLIFENLRTNGFKLHDRKKPWNLDHSLEAMKSYGKFHALSLAVRDQKPDIYKNLTKDLKVFEVFDNDKLMRSFYEKPLRNAIQLLKNANRNDLAIKYEENFDSVLSTPTEEEDKLVICHSDCWNNNFMFKYQDGDEETPSKLVLLDFQLSTLDTPVKDLVFNIYTTCDKSVLDHLDLLLVTYYETLSTSIRSLGSNPDEIFTFEQLNQLWKKYSKFGALISLILVKLELIDKADAPDLTKLTEDDVKCEDWYNIKPKDLEEYNRRVLDVYIHHGERFL
ncbi:hypothetical protein HHI36_012462 [Cryptolaemus montrouzieri]|uniref:CHK kinase-like domain-containing protein n=1 Tax=Cryptolaemus montrouzieri TaxID=559131 RepID=A0ABD2NEW4_9CUCU